MSNRNNLRRHVKGDRVKWVITFTAIILLAVGVAAALTVGFTNGNPYGWLDERYSFKSEMPELTADVLPEDGESPYTLVLSYNDGETVELVYTTDGDTTVEYTLTVNEGVTADDVTAAGESTTTYKYVVKSADDELPVGEWVKLADVEADEAYTSESPASYALLFEADGTIAPADEIAAEIFK